MKKLKEILIDLTPEFIGLLAMIVLLLLCGCSAAPHAIREQTWPLEMAIFGKVEPWGYGDELLDKLPCVDED